MNSVVLTIILIGVMFIAGLAGFRAQTRLSEVNSVEKSRDMIGAMMGLVSLLLALVLGTLVGNAYFFSVNQQAQLQSMMTNVILLDKSLADYGPEAKPLRDEVKGALVHIYQSIWVERSLEPEEVSASAALSGLSPFEKALNSLTPKTPEQKAALTSAESRFSVFEQTRILMALQLTVPFSKSLLMVVIVWATLLFFGYGLLSKDNSTSRAALALGAVSVVCAIFIIMELGEPYSATFRMSPAALQQAIAAIDP